MRINSSGNPKNHLLIDVDSGSGAGMTEINGIQIIINGDSFQVSFRMDGAYVFMDN